MKDQQVLDEANRKASESIVEAARRSKLKAAEAKRINPLNLEPSQPVDKNEANCRELEKDKLFDGGKTANPCGYHDEPKQWAKVLLKRLRKPVGVIMDWGKALQTKHDMLPTEEQVAKIPEGWIWCQGGPKHEDSRSQSCTRRRTFGSYQ